MSQYPNPLTAGTVVRRTIFETIMETGVISDIVDKA
jgi:hypothetical protein